MDKFVIICDVTCDLNKELRDKYGIKYVKGHMTGPDGKERITTLDWNDVSHDDFYNDLKKNPNGYSTSPASPDEFKEVFERYLIEGYDILSISISTALSGTYNFSLQAKEMLCQCRAVAHGCRRTDRVEGEERSAPPSQRQTGTRRTIQRTGRKHSHACCYFGIDRRTGMDNTKKKICF